MLTISTESLNKSILLANSYVENARSVACMPDNVEMKDSNNRDNRYQDWGLEKVINNVIKTHHTYIRDRTPIIITLLQKLSHHESDDNTLIKISNLFLQLASLVNQQIALEGSTMFPLLKLIADNRQHSNNSDQTNHDALRKYINKILQYHREAASIFGDIKKLSGNYSKPKSVCTLVTTLYSRLQDFETNVLNRIHLDDEVLFPIVIKIVDKN